MCDGAVRFLENEWGVQVQNSRSITSQELLSLLRVVVIDDVYLKNTQFLNTFTQVHLVPKLRGDVQYLSQLWLQVVEPKGSTVSVVETSNVRCVIKQDCL